MLIFINKLIFTATVCAAEAHHHPNGDADFTKELVVTPPLSGSPGLTPTSSSASDEDLNNRLNTDQVMKPDFLAKVQPDDVIESYLPKENKRRNENIEKAKEGNIEGLFEVADMYTLGQITIPGTNSKRELGLAQVQQAINCYNHIIEHASVESIKASALWNNGLLYIDRLKDNSTGLALIQQAADLGNVVAESYLNPPEDDEYY